MNLLIRCIALLGLSYVFIGSSLSAGACENKLCSLNIEPTQTHRIKINDVLSDLASSCRITVLHTDSFSRSKLDEELSALYIKDFTLDELFELLLHEHDLFYDYDTNLARLKISYIKTKSFNIDYINVTQMRTYSARRRDGRCINKCERRPV